MKPKTQKQMLINQLAQLFPKNMEDFTEEQLIMIEIAAQIEKLKENQKDIQKIIDNQKIENVNRTINK
jgi:hypothetical protein